MTPLLVAAGVVLAMTMLLAYSLCVIAGKSDAAARTIHKKQEQLKR